MRLDSRSSGLAINWVGEVITWAERQTLESGELEIFTFNMGQKNGKLLTKVNVTGVVKKFCLSPMTR